ncbi:MAG TPA: hypothetical protein VLC97_05225 [Rhodanobacteraceae bacterium]|jgi:hypothetical protein|nr:hypothetical protein [Rhodanobacteraceae bacterium]
MASQGRALIALSGRWLIATTIVVATIPEATNAVPLTLIQPTAQIGPDVSGEGLEFAQFSAAMDAREGLLVSAEAPSQYSYSSRPGLVHLLRGSVNGWSQEAEFTVAPVEDWTIHARAASAQQDEAIVGIGPLSDEPYHLLDGFRIYRRTAGTWAEVAHVDHVPSPVARADGLGTAVSIDGAWAAIGNASDANVLLYHANADGTAWTLTQTLTALPSDPSRFGKSLVIEGDELIVGAPGDTTFEEPANLGAVVLFRLSGDTWQRTDTIASPLSTGGSLFGWSLARRHDLLVVGARGNYSDNQLRGRACVYRKDAGTGVWSGAGTLLPSDSSFEDGFSLTLATDGTDILAGTSIEKAYLFRPSYFGWDEYKVGAPIPGGVDFGRNVAIPFSSTLLVGAASDSSSGAGGSGSIYEYAAGSQIDLTRRVDLGDSADRDQFGSALDADGPLLAVGAPLDDDEHGLNTGSLSIYRVDYANPNRLTKLAKVVPPYVGAQDGFGFAVSVSGDRIAALSTYGFQIETGATGQDGAVYLYRWNRSDNTIAFEQRLQHPGNDDYWWGTAVSLEGDLLAVGAGQGYSAYQSGHVYVYRYHADSEQWQLAQTLVADGDDPGFGFGITVKWCNGKLVIGGPTGQYGPGSTGGAAYVFSPDPGGSFLQRAKVIATDADATNYFGNSLACTRDGTVLAIGNFTDAYVFERAAETPDAWNQVAQITVPQDGENEGFITDMRFSKHVLYAGVGTYGDFAASETGSVYVLRKLEGNWTISDQLRSADAQPGDTFGTHIAMIGAGFAASSPSRSNSPATNIGRVEAFGQLDDVFTEGFDNE